MPRTTEYFRLLGFLWWVNKVTSEYIIKVMGWVNGLSGLLE